MKYAKYVICFITLSLPIFTTGFLIYLYGYRFPYWDEILYLPLYDKLNQGILSINDLFFLQNNHRPFFPRIITLILARISSWNELTILYCSLSFVIAIYIILGYVINTEKKDEYKNTNNKYIKLLSLCYVSLFLFSWSQMENWIWGLQLMMFLTNLSYVLVLFIMYKYEMNILNLIMCLLLSVLASFSFANGLLIWFVPLPFLLYKIAKAKKQNYALLLIWILCAIAVISFYFTNYHTPSISKTNESTNLIQKFLYFLLYIGSPVSGFIFTPPWHGNKIPEPHLIHYLIGILGILFWVLLLHKTKNILFTEIQYCKQEKGIQFLFKKRVPKIEADEYFFWKSLSLFAIFSGVLITLGRSQIGLGQSLSSRYITTGCLFWCSLIGLLNFYIKNSEILLEKYNKMKYSYSLIKYSFWVLFIVLNFSPIYLNKEWHQIAQWKNLGWYALSSGYDGRLFWTDLWGDKDFIQPKILKKEIFPIFEKYNLSNINQFENKNKRKTLTIIFINETKYFIENKLWKPAVCYLDTAIFLDPELQDFEKLKNQIPSEIFEQYEKYQSEWRLITEK